VLSQANSLEGELGVVEHVGIFLPPWIHQLGLFYLKYVKPDGIWFEI
jgi:hypothetical protein